MTYPVVENVAGGTYTGSGASPSSTTLGDINTSGTNRLVVIVCVTARGNSSADYNFPTAISAAGLTFTSLIHQEFTYTDTPGGGSYPVASFSIDVFTAPAATAQSSLTWTSTMSGDGFVNDGSGYVFAVANVNPSAPYDASVSLPKNANSFTGSATTPEITGFTTDDTNDLLMTICVNHNSSSDTVPSATSSWTEIAAPIHADSGAGATHNYVFVQTLDQASPGTISISAAYTDEFWDMIGLAFTDGASPVVFPHSFGTVIT